MKRTNVLILSAGAIADDISSIFGSIPSGMVPINSKPAVSWIIDSLLSQEFVRFFVTIGFKGETIERFLGNAYKERGAIECISVDDKKPPGNAIIEALVKIESRDVLIVLGDTIVKGDIDINQESFVYVSSRFTDTAKWCLVKPQKNGNIEKIFDKRQNINTEGLLALIGVYYFKNVNILRSVVANIANQDCVQISALLEQYHAKDAIRCIEQKGWIDIGHLDRYYEAKILLTKPRAFNYFEYDSLRGTIKKRSLNSEKLRDEINWYQALPNDLKVFAPRVLTSSGDGDASITMEYYGYPALSELMVYGSLHPIIWKQIFKKLIDVLRVFLEHKGSVAWEDYYFMYVKKTRYRIAQAIKQNQDISELVKFPSVIVNGRELKNIGELNQFIEQMAQELYAGSDVFNCFIHGDFCFSNILFDPASGVMRLIDPRGSWGSGYYGDIRYDLAKLRHSVVGSYDFIVNDSFTITKYDNTLELVIHASLAQKKIESYFDSLIVREWNIRHIVFIEGLLFLSMIPLHTERKERQLAMFAIGLDRINSAYDWKQKKDYQ